jgi:hypothetical protein
MQSSERAASMAVPSSLAVREAANAARDAADLARARAARALAARPGSNARSPKGLPPTAPRAQPRLGGLLRSPYSNYLYLQRH